MDKQGFSFCAVLLAYLLQNSKFTSKFKNKKEKSRKLEWQA